MPPTTPLHTFATLATLAQSSSDAGAIVAAIIGLVFTLFFFALIIVTIIGLWKMFTKAGQPGWAALIPFYNIYIMCKIVGRPGWWLILMMLPVISIVISIIVSNDLSKSFGRGVGTTVGLVLVPFVFIPILGFGSAQYQGPAALVAE